MKWSPGISPCHMKSCLRKQLQKISRRVLQNRGKPKNANPFQYSLKGHVEFAEGKWMRVGHTKKKNRITEALQTSTCASKHLGRSRGYIRRLWFVWWCLKQVFEKQWKSLEGLPGLQTTLEKEPPKSWQVSLQSCKDLQKHIFAASMRPSISPCHTRRWLI